MEIIDQNYL